MAIAAELLEFYSAIVNGLSLQARDGASRRRLLMVVDRATAAFSRDR